MKNPRIAKCEYVGACYWLKVSSSWTRLPVSGNVAKLQHFVKVRRFTSDVLGQWPDLIWKQKQFLIVRLEWGVSRAKFQLSIANLSYASAGEPRLKQMQQCFTKCPITLMRTDAHLQIACTLRYYYQLHSDPTFRISSKHWQAFFWSTPQNMIIII